jgi:cytoskeleton protein RodZ
MAASIGEQLRLAREQREIGLRDISDQTRISIRFLEAIESNDFDRLPGGVFTRSFIKAYARCVGYNEREAIEGYTRYLREHSDTGSDEVATTPMHPKVYTETPATRSPVLTVFLAILILALLTGAALTALHWFQKRAAVVPPKNQPSLAMVVEHAISDRNVTAVNRGPGSRETDYEAVLQ